MDNRSDDSELIERLANEVTGNVRRGESLSSSELQQRYPELSDDIEGWVNTLAVLEEASLRRHTKRPIGAVVNAAGQHQKSLGGFSLIREISRGGMGIVYEAEQKSLQRRVAVKVLPPSPLLTDVERIRFEREATAVARLHHSHIVPVFGTGVEQGVQYCVMQYIDGHSLDQLIAGLRIHFGYANCSRDTDTDSRNRDSENAIFAASLLRNRKPGEIGDSPGNDVESEQPVGSASSESGFKPQANLPESYWRNIARIGADVADALSHAHHQGVLHRDIKPGNLLLDRDHDIWVTDFGLAKLHDKENLTGTGNLIGTLRYTSPEQFDGQADARSDVYALGLTLYELCTLEPAFSATDRRELMREVMTVTPVRPRMLNPEIPRDLETIILKAMAPEPENRYQKAGDLSADLQNFLDDRPLMARRQTPWERGWRWCRRHRLETALGGFAIAMLLLFSMTASIAYVREARLRHESDESAARTRQALDRVYDFYLPDWTTSSSVSAHGKVSVSPESAQFLEELVEFYDDLAQRGRKGMEKDVVLESAAALQRVGLIYLRLGQFSKSQASYAEANKRLGRYYDAFPSNDLRLEQARILNGQGNTFWTDRRYDQARRNHHKALGLIYEILPAPEDDYQVHFELARTLYLCGRQGRGLGGGVMRQVVDVNEEVTFMGQGFVARAVSILEPLVGRYPDNLEMRHLLALCYREHADRSIDVSGELADESLKQAIRILEELVAAAPDDPKFRFALCTTLQWCSPGAQSSPSACDVVAGRIQRSAEIAQQLRTQRPDEWIYAASHVEALIKLANVLNRAGRLEAALEVSQQAIDSSTELSATYQNCEIFQLWVGHACRRRGDLLEKTADSEATLRAYDRAILELQGLLHDEPSGVEIAVLKNLHRAFLGRVQVLTRLNSIDELKIARQQTAAYQERLELARASLAK